MTVTIKRGTMGMNQRRADSRGSERGTKMAKNFRTMIIGEKTVEVADENVSEALLEIFGEDAVFCGECEGFSLCTNCDGDGCEVCDWSGNCAECGGSGVE